MYWHRMGFRLVPANDNSMIWFLYHDDNKISERLKKPNFAVRNKFKFSDSEDANHHNFQSLVGFVWNNPMRSLDGADPSNDNSDTWPDHPDRDRGAMPPRTTADKTVCTPCAVTQSGPSPLRDSAHMDSYAHVFPI